MPTTLEDLYVHPKFVEKVERPIKAKISSLTFQTQKPTALNPSAVKPIGVTLNSVKFWGEDEERIQGEVVVSAKASIDATVTLQFKERVDDQVKDVTEEIPQALEAYMNFSLPWGWQAKDVRFVAESAHVLLNDLRRA
jgi:hypothetical protein